MPTSLSTPENVPLSNALDYVSNRNPGKVPSPWVLIAWLQAGYAMGFVGMSFFRGLVPPDPDDIRASLTWMPLVIGFLDLLSLVPSVIFAVVVWVLDRNFQRTTRRFSPFWCVVLGTVHAAASCILGALFLNDGDVAGGVATMLIVTCLIPASLAFVFTKRAQYQMSVPKMWAERTKTEGS